MIHFVCQGLFGVYQKGLGEGLADFLKFNLFAPANALKFELLLKSIKIKNLKTAVHVLINAYPNLAGRSLERYRPARLDQSH
jgi:hypothetical protein